MQVAVNPHPRALPPGSRSRVVPHGPDVVLGEAAEVHGPQEMLEALPALLGVTAAVRGVRRLGGRLHMQRLEEGRQDVGRMVAAGDRAVVQRHPLNPCHDGPDLGEALGRRTVPHGDRDRQRQARGQGRQPPALLELQIRGGGHPLHPDRQLLPKAPHLVAPTTRHLADGQRGQVWMLVPQQIADQILADLNLRFDHAKSQYLRQAEATLLFGRSSSPVGSPKHSRKTCRARFQQP